MPVVPDTAFEQHIFPQGQGIYNTTDRATAEAFGGQVGATLEKTGNMLQQNAIQRQQLANETAVQDIYANHFSPLMRAIGLFSKNRPFQMSRPGLWKISKRG